MSASEKTLDGSTAGDLNSPGWNHSVWLGFLLVFVGLVSYFLVFARYPALRDFPWLNLPLVCLGLLIAAWGVRRAFDSGRTILAKIVAGISLLLSLGLVALFATYIFYLSYQLPQDAGLAHTSTPVPEFALLDQNQATIRPIEYRGRKVVMVFYRGNW